MMTTRTRRGNSLDFEGRRAGLVSRAVAAGIDAAVVSTCALLAGFAAGVARYVLFGPPVRPLDLSPQLSTASWCAIAVIYLTWGWMTAGRTAGDQLMGLRVVGRSGRRLGLARAVLRAGLYVICPAGLLWVAVSRHNASFQDIIVRSVVVYDWHYKPGHVQPDQPTA
jgi:uncharacterized RDD family membrane protein YckC